MGAGNGQLTHHYSCRKRLNYCIAGVTSNNGLVDRNHFVFSFPIGGGGFSAVTLAMHGPTKKWLAMKEMSIPGAIVHSGGLSMIRSELTILKSLGKHNYIVGLHFAFRDKIKCYLGEKHLYVGLLF
jgi:hypothetical protein